MKKGTKGLLIAVGVFAAAGIGLCVAGVSMGAANTGKEVIDQVNQAFRNESYPGWFHLRKVYWSSREEEDWEDTDAKSQDLAFAGNLEISLKYDELILQEYDGDTIKVETWGDSKDDIRTEEGSGKIVIQDTRSGTVKKRKKVRVSVPSGKKFDSVTLGVDAGSIEMTGTMNADEFTVEVGAGEFSGEGITAQKCDLQVGAGTIDLNYIDAKELNADCGTGEIDMSVTGKEQDYNYELSCGMGAIDLNESEYSGLGVEKDISNEGAARNMVLSCGMGEIDVEFTGE